MSVHRKKPSSGRMLWIVLAGTVALILLAVLIASILRSPATDAQDVPASASLPEASGAPGGPLSALLSANSDESSTPVDSAGTGVPAATPFPDAATADSNVPSVGDGAPSVGDGMQSPASSPTEVPASGGRAALRPAAMPGGYLPIFEGAKTEEKIIAVTVDDCFQFNNLDRILDYAVEAGGKITIFPIGKNVMKEGLQPVIRRAHALGMELENHSFSHSAFYKLSTQDMATEIFNQQRAISYVLGVDYQMHFMRTRGGDNRKDLRTHQYIESLGYYGMAHWNVNGSKTSVSTLCRELAPGNIYLFHTTDSDAEKLSVFLKYAAEQGYQLVTLNEMFGYPENEVRDLTSPVEQWEIPAPKPYTYTYQTLKKGDFLWEVNLLQQRLIELGWLEGNADGEYGEGTYMAVGYFQLAAGVQANGKATPETQEILFSDAAPKASEFLAQMAAASSTPNPPTSTPDGSSAPDGGSAPVATTTPRPAASDHPEIDFSMFD